MGFQNVTDRGVADVIAHFGELTLDTVESLRWILFRELQDQIDDHLRILGRPSFFSYRSE